MKQGWTSDSKIRKGLLAEVRFVLKIGKGRENRRGNREGVRANHAEISGKSIEERGRERKEEEPKPWGRNGFGMCEEDREGPCDYITISVVRSRPV